MSNIELYNGDCLELMKTLGNESVNLIITDPPYGVNFKNKYYDDSEDYFLSFDGIAGNENNIVDIPQDIYSEHLLLDSGNSSFRRVIGKNNNVNVYESLYVRKK
jgi:DNA modification methylase